MEELCFVQPFSTKSPQLRMDVAASSDLGGIPNPTFILSRCEGALPGGSSVRKPEADCREVWVPPAIRQQRAGHCGCVCVCVCQGFQVLHQESTGIPKAKLQPSYDSDYSLEVSMLRLNV